MTREARASAACGGNRKNVARAQQTSRVFVLSRESGVGEVASPPRWPGKWKRNGQLICCLRSLLKFAEGGSKVIANFSSGNTSNCHGPRCQSRPRFLQMQSWCKYIVFGVHNYAKCKSLKPQCLRGQQSNLGLNQRCTEKGQAAAELNRPHSLRSPSRHFSQHTCHHASLPLHPYPFLPSSFHILQTRLWLSDV